MNNINKKSSIGLQTSDLETKIRRSDVRPRCRMI